MNPNRLEDSINSPNMQKEILDLIERIYFRSKCAEQNDELDCVEDENEPNVIEYELKVCFFAKKLLRKKHRYK